MGYSNICDALGRNNHPWLSSGHAPVALDGQESSFDALLHNYVLNLNRCAGWKHLGSSLRVTINSFNNGADLACKFARHVGPPTSFRLDERQPESSRSGSSPRKHSFYGHRLHIDRNICVYI